MADYTKYFDNCMAIFQGGGCKAIAYIGAYKVAYNKGAIFNEVAGTSAGAIVAALIAAGATPEELERFVYSLPMTSLVTDPPHQKCGWFKRHVINKILQKISLPAFVTQDAILTFFAKYGIYEIDTLYQTIEKELKKILDIKEDRNVQFSDLKTNLHIVTSDFQQEKVVVFNRENSALSVAEAVCASCSIPGYFQPYKDKYVDGGLLSNLPYFVFSEKPNYNKKLCFKTFSKSTKSETGLKKYLLSLLSTIVDGAVSIQKTSNEDSYEILIDAGEITAVDFDLMDKEHIKQLIDAGYNAASKFFANEEAKYYPINEKKRKVLENEHQMYALLATLSYKKVEEVLISSSSTKWAWTLFPTLLKWVENQAIITIYCHTDETIDEDEQARRRLLRKLKCSLNENAQRPADVFFLKCENKWCGVICQEKNRKFMGVYYESDVDSYAINAAIEHFNVDTHTNPKTSYRGIVRTSEKEMIETMSKYHLYSSSQLHYEYVTIDDNLLFMTNQTRLEKYRQIDKLFNLYKQSELEYFEPAKIVFSDNSESIISPIVIEEQGDQLVVIEGKTRLTYAYYHGLRNHKIKALMVRNVIRPLPISSTDSLVSISRLIITDDKKDKNLNLSEDFRHIEEHLHPSASYLK